MFALHPPPPQVADELLTLLRRAEPATIGHFRHVGFMAPEIRGLLPDRRIAGTAVTVRCYGSDLAIISYALGKLRPGDVLVIDRSGDARHAACGGSVALAAREAGCLGIVVDGVVTDIQELRQFGLPVWARGLSAVTGKREFTHGEFCVPISCGGVAVAPGDAVLADENGVLVLPPGDVAADAQRAIDMQAAEQETFRRLLAGEKLPDMNGTNARISELLR